MHNPSNERIKRQYLAFLKEAKRHSEATVDAVAKALARFEADTRYRDFKAFHFEQAVAFKRHLAEQDSLCTGHKLSQATRYATLTHLKRFFQWLAREPGYKSRIAYSDAEYFNISDKEARIATARRQREFPTLEQVKHLIATMPAGSDIEKRDRALLAFTLLTGARDSAIASIKLKHVDLDSESVYQDGRDVKTKNSKTFPTYFFPVGDEVQQVFADWVHYLREVKLWSNTAPLFPSTDIAQDANHQFEARGLSLKHWRTAAPIRRIFRDSFRAAGMPYFNPHSLRRTLVQLGKHVCQTVEHFKAWSQNLGHEAVLTTLTSYGQVAVDRQGEIMRTLRTAEPVNSGDEDRLVKAVMRALRESRSVKDRDGA